MIAIPFNHQPESVSVKTGSYSIPAGKYARVTYNLSVSAVGRITVTGDGRGTSNLEPMTTTADGDSTSGTFFVPSGTALDVSSSAASATDSGSGSTDALNVISTSTASFTVGGTTAATISARATATCRNISGSSVDYVSANVSGAANARYIVELFSEIG